MHLNMVEDGYVFEYDEPLGDRRRYRAIKVKGIVATGFVPVLPILEAALLGPLVSTIDFGPIEAYSVSNGIKVEDWHKDFLKVGHIGKASHPLNKNVVRTTFEATCMRVGVLVLDNPDTVPYDLEVIDLGYAGEYFPELGEPA